MPTSAIAGGDDGGFDGGGAWSARLEGGGSIAARNSAGWPAGVAAVTSARSPSDSTKLGTERGCGRTELGALSSSSRTDVMVADDRVDLRHELWMLLDQPGDG